MHSTRTYPNHALKAVIGDLEPMMHSMMMGVRDQVRDQVREVESGRAEREETLRKRVAELEEENCRLRERLGMVAL